MRIETLDLTRKRIGENQSRFRDENERIEATAERLAIPGHVPFICECPDPACTEIVRLTLDEYEDVRSEPRRFFAMPGHQGASLQLGAAIVVADCDSYVVVEKIGVAGEVAEEHYDDLAAG